MSFSEDEDPGTWQIGQRQMNMLKKWKLALHFFRILLNRPFSSVSPMNPLKEHNNRAFVLLVRMEILTVLLESFVRLSFLKSTNSKVSTKSRKRAGNFFLCFCVSRCCRIFSGQSNENVSRQFSMKMFPGSSQKRNWCFLSIQGHFRPRNLFVFQRLYEPPECASLAKNHPAACSQWCTLLLQCLLL